MSVLFLAGLCLIASSLLVRLLVPKPVLPMMLVPLLVLLLVPRVVLPVMLVLLLVKVLTLSEGGMHPLTLSSMMHRH